MATDRFGNDIDPSVGYARGKFLRASADEVRRLRHAQAIAGCRVRTLGIDSIGIFTGNPRYFPLKPEDINGICEEWIGPGLIADDLATAAIDHLGGKGTESVAVVNRTSAGIVAAILALSDGNPVVSLVPDGDRSHASVIRGCKLANVPLVEVEASQDVGAVLNREQPTLFVVTTVTSSLARLEDTATEMAITTAKAQGAIVFMDEAYGARLRPVLHAGKKSLMLGGDVAITNTDKAGLCGPRAAVVVGDPTAVVSIVAKASELGMEARAPIAAGALRSLQGFDPQVLMTEAQEGQTIADALSASFGADLVVRSDLGPMIDEQDVLSILLEKAGRTETDIVPGEATAAAGMLMLENAGLLTVNTHGQPGGRVSIRLKPTVGAVGRMGGADALAEIVNTALDEVAKHLGDQDWFAKTLFGKGTV